MARNAPREQFGRDYAASIAASMDPRIQYYTGGLAALRPQEEIDADVTKLYDPAIAAAKRIGEDVANVGQSGLTAIAGLGSSLPGLDLGLITDAARAVTRGTGTAALTGGVAETSARAALASDMLRGRRMREDEERRLGENLMTAREEQMRTEADWLPAAAQRQQMATVSTQNQLLLQDLKNAPVARRRAILENRLLSGQVTGQVLQNAAFRKELKGLGFTDKQISDLTGGGGGAKKTKGRKIG
jgi:hypothetical protein